VSEPITRRVLEPAHVRLACAEARLMLLEVTSHDKGDHRCLQARCQDGDPGLALAALDRAGYERPVNAWRALRPIRLRSGRSGGKHALVLEWRPPALPATLPATLLAKRRRRMEKEEPDGR